MSSDIRPLQLALQTAKGFGFCVVPVYGNQEFGGCLCSKGAACKSPGKHPVGDKWQERASNNEAEIRAMFAGMTNDYNYGILTGPRSGIFVLDVDGEVGKASLAKLEAEHGKLPDTLFAHTGGGGLHIFFKYPDQKIAGKSCKIGDKLDTRGENNQVVGSGSIHRSGKMYQWDFPGQPVVDAPAWLIDLACADKKTEKKAENLNINNPPPYKTSIGGLPPWTVEQVRSMLDKIHPDDCYDDWYQIGMAIKSYGLPFQVWDDWSKGGSKYQSSELPSKWNSFKGSGVTIGTIYYHAEKAGWKPEQDSRSTRYEYTGKPYTRPPESPHDPLTGEINDEFEEKPQNKPDQDQPKQEQAEQPKAKTSGLYYVPARDIHPAIDVNDFVQGVLGDEQLSVVYGESNCGKTFFMADLALHVAQGRRWRDRRVEQGGVMYAALEGGRGLRNRISAYRKHNMILDKDMPFAMLPCQLDFFSANTNIDEFLELLVTAEKDIGKPRLIVIDTLAYAMAGGDENSGQDMGALVYHANKLKISTGAHICFVHHSGKNKALGARGHSSLRAAVDTEMEVSREDGADFSTVKIVKQREMDMADDMFFKLHIVELATNKYDEPVTSCVVAPAMEPEKKAKVVKLTANEQFVYDALVAALIDRGIQRPVIKDGAPINCVDYFELDASMTERGSKEMVKNDGTSTVKTATDAARKSLKAKGKINFNRHYLWVINDQDNGG